MAKYKKAEEYYLKQDILIKISKTAELSIGAGTKLRYLSEDLKQIKFAILDKSSLGSAFSINILTENANEFITNFSEESQRSAK